MKIVLQSAYPTVKEVVRVSVSNNFNCTEAEFKQLGQFVTNNPSRYFFVNCNINTRHLENLNDHPYKAVITLNPKLTVEQKALQKLSEIDKDKVAFVRVKYLPDNPTIKNLIRQLSERGYSTVITMQRFNGKRTLLKYTSLEYYKFECSRYRLLSEHVAQLCSYADALPNTYICDRAGIGCKGCGLCSKLTYGSEQSLSTLHLSTSGMCKFNCPDCYAKTMQNFLRRIGMPLISFDVIRKNSKQSGRTTHIKRVIKEHV